jgi:hypothetical protein
VVRVGALANCNSEGIAYAFLDKMFNRFGIIVEVFTDHGTKY